jgi:universal stress protein A
MPAIPNDDGGNMLVLRNIIVPTDFSPHAEMALEHAIEFAKRFSAKIHLLHAYQVTLLITGPEQFVLPADLIESGREAARAQLEGLEKRLEQARVQYQSHLSPMAPVTAILELAESLPADLIVMGTRGLTGMKHVLVGSLAERTVRLASCPVMTVKGKSE